MYGRILFQGRLTSAVAVSFVVTSGFVYSCGHGGAGQLGLGNLRDYHKPTLVMDLVDAHAEVCFAAAGDGHSIFLTSQGRVWVCGAGEEGQLGHGGPRDEDNYCGGRMRPCLLGPIPSFDGAAAKIVYAACGFAHSLLVDDRGCVYSFGDGMRGRLGHGSEQSFDVPTRITYFDHCPPPPTAEAQVPEVVEVAQCAAGRFHSAFVSRDGRVYTCGLTQNLQLGHVQPETERPLFVSLPALVSSLHGIQIIQVGCGDQFTAYLAADGQVFTNGTNDRGCCGVGDSKDREAPTAVALDLPWSAVVDWNASDSDD